MEHPAASTLQQQRIRMTGAHNRMNTTPITANEFPQPQRSSRAGRLTSEGTKMLAALTVGTGFSMPCEWQHRDTKQGQHKCPGTEKFQSLGQSVRLRADPTLRIRTRCVDGTLYVLRVPERLEDRAGGRA